MPISFSLKADSSPRN